MYSKHVIGIYIGTTDSCVAVYDNNQVKILLTDSKGNRSIKSCVAFDGSEFIVGNEAFNHMTYNPQNCIFDIKMLIGKTYSELLLTLQTQHRWPFNIESDENEHPMIRVTQSHLSLKLYPEQIYAMLIAKLKHIAEATLGCLITDAVISVPVTFDYAQREATKFAAIIAGLKSIRLIKEPLAAALPSGIEKREKSAKDVAIVNIGRTKTEVCILTKEDLIFEIKSLNSCSDMNGDVFDEILVNYCVRKFKEIMKNEFIQIPAQSLKRLRKDCEKAKKILSFSQQTTIETNDLSEGRDFYYVLTRKEFEELCDHIFQRIHPLLHNSLKGLEDVKIEKVLVIGGSAQIPKLADMISNCFSGAEHVFLKDFQEFIAGGAAIFAAALFNPSYDKLNSDFLLLDAVGLSLGIEDEDGNLVQMIPRGSTIPINREYEINQKNSVIIKIYEGEQKLARNNLLIKELTFYKVNEFAKIKVSLSVDADSMISVEVKEDGETQNKMGEKLENRKFSPFEIQFMTAQNEKLLSRKLDSC